MLPAADAAAGEDDDSDDDDSEDDTEDDDEDDDEDDEDDDEDDDDEDDDDEDDDDEDDEDPELIPKLPWLFSHWSAGSNWLNLPPKSSSFSVCFNWVWRLSFRRISLSWRISPIFNSDWSLWVTWPDIVFTWLKIELSSFVWDSMIKVFPQPDEVDIEGGHEFADMWLCWTQ